ncbi:MAG: Rieske (2Fe-2S) protein [Solirubrobacterales bacterium]|nr:Rieske (2Fe-2S) protein [Solirubrobacterales bacterium]
MSAEGLPDVTRPFAEAVESFETVDPIGEKVGEAVRAAIPPGKLKDLLSGTAIGHALHPLLTDVVIGAFMSASLLDLLGGDDDGRAAERLLGVGIAAYLPTALTGATDYADRELNGPEIRRTGVVHAATNSVALGCYVASLRARRGGRPARGKLLALLGASALGAAGYLGGHLSYVQGIGVNQTAFDEGPDDWTPAGSSTDVAEGKPARMMAGETPVLLVRSGDRLHAMHDRCSHRGCPLSDGDLDGEVIVCTCHGSRFRLADGSIERGPATTPQPSYEVRERDGGIEVKL